jgi:hypothetical protein
VDPFQFNFTLSHMDGLDYVLCCSSNILCYIFFYLIDVSFWMFYHLIASTSKSWYLPYQGFLSNGKPSIHYFQGRFEILSLSGSFMPSENGGTKGRSGGMSVSLAGPDGRVVGGGLAGLLVAAGPVQVHYSIRRSNEKEIRKRSSAAGCLQISK